ncbi:MAG TPA: FecR domain-containing protein [Chitinophaga sp.]|uniref:FecR family protein n=1 Tax=Chitinophaga sp. TaxID=1869181 RepID=UPI002CD0EEEF|nr:FecR domain-containing protein [Chitinophaga sp.]HVI46105.1 FecR domain-containing protein [Chitinophaga sp.]
MNEVLLKELLDQYLTGTISESGKEQLAEALARPEYEDMVSSQLKQSFMDNVFEGEEDPVLKASIHDYLQQQIRQNRPQAKVSSIRYWWAAAAAVVAMLLVASFYILQVQEHRLVAGKKIQTKFRNDVNPGSYGAVLTLANGTTVILDSAHNGTLPQQGDASVTKSGNSLQYNVATGDGAVVYNTMTTPRGRQYNLMLADGSRVWLNAGSSITFPTAFTGNNRTVKMTGEVYFEIAPDVSKPFRVTVNGTEVKVLGTHFNINSYDDESTMKTTLLEGAVTVVKNDKSLVMAPGQQLQMNNAGGMNLVTDIDTDEVIAWKNGFFSFHNADIPAVMRQLARWYNVDVEYRGDIPKREFEGSIDRSLTLARVLAILESMKVHFSIEEDKRIVILP